MSIQVINSVCGLSDEIPPALAQCAVVARYASGESIYRCSDRIENWYQLLGGAARKSALSGDGRRHVVDFILPSDPFGLAAGGRRHFCVEALVPGTLVARFPRSAAERLADCDAVVGRYIREAAFKSIVNLQQRMVILGQTSGLERVSSFLLEFAARSQCSPARAMLLPMSRYDIADYVGMAVETVSRTMTELRKTRVIAFRSARHVRINDRSALEELAKGLSSRTADPAVTEKGEPYTRDTSRPGIDTDQGTGMPEARDYTLNEFLMRGNGATRW